MYKLFASVFVVILLFTGQAFCQVTGAVPNNSQDELIFVMKQKFPPNVVHKYTLTDSTNVHRIFSDSSEQKYSYNNLLHFNEKAPGRRDADGFLDIRVSIDSLAFDFMDSTKNKHVEYNTNWDEGRPPFSFRPFTQWMVLVGKECELTYSTYNEVVEIAGERYFEELDRLKDPKIGFTPEDSIKKFIWVDGVDLDNIAFIADVSKGLLPPNDGKIPKDSSWKAIIHNRVNGVHIIDTVLLEIVYYSAKQYIIEGESIGMTIDKKRVLPNNLNILSYPSGIEGTGKYKIKMTPRGAIQVLETVYDVYVTVPLKSEYYMENIQSKMVWNLLNRYKY